MKKWLLIFSLLILLAACSGTPTSVVTVPTLAVLPSATASLTSTLTSTPSATIPPSVTPSSTFTPRPSDTSAPTDTRTPLPSPTFTLTASNTPTFTLTPTQTYTLTPSLTITDTITPTPSPTFTPMPELDSLGLLALLSERATVLPPQMLYNPQTLTAVAFDAQTLIAAQNASPTAPGAPGGTPIMGTPVLATLPPPMTTTCSSAPPGGLGGSFAADPSLTQSIGCPQGAKFSTTTAIESFEHGSMIYVQGSPNAIYVLTLDNRFEHFDDTWVSGVDPESTGLTPPAGMFEPIRGFGKVWRNNLDVRGSLGWATDQEKGSSASVQLFDRGRAIFLPQSGQTYLLIDDPGGVTGSWRTLPTSF